MTSNIRRIIYDGVLIAVGIVFALLVHEIGGLKLGQILLPMHYSVILAGLLLGPWDGFAVGILTPLLSGVLVGMPPLMPPIAIFMAFEMATYGIIVGYLNKRKVNIYINLIIAMLAGRIIYSLSYYIIGYMVGIHLRPLLAIAISFLSGIIGVILQLVIIPLLYYTIKSRITTRNAMK